MVSMSGRVHAEPLGLIAGNPCLLWVMMMWPINLTMAKPHGVFIVVLQKLPTDVVASRCTIAGHE